MAESKIIIIQYWIPFKCRVAFMFVLQDKKCQIRLPGREVTSAYISHLAAANEL